MTGITAVPFGVRSGKLIIRVCADMLGGCGWSPVTVIPRLLWGPGTWARCPREGVCMGTGSGEPV